MSSKEAPYATLHDLPKFQEREKVGSAPWEKDQRPVQNTRGPPLDAHYYSPSQTAPFATSENQPIPRQMTISESPKSGQKTSPHLQNGVQNKPKTTTAPWDRDECHYSAKIKCGNSARSAPFATEQNHK